MSLSNLSPRQDSGPFTRGPRGQSGRSLKSSLSFGAESPRGGAERDGKLPPAHTASLLLRVAASFFTYFVVTELRIPPFLLSFYVYTLAGVACLVVSRPLRWVTHKRFLLIVFHAGWQVLSFTIWVTALVMVMPIYALLGQYLECAFVVLFASCLRKQRQVVLPRHLSVLLSGQVALPLFLMIAVHYATDSPPYVDRRTSLRENILGVALLVVYACSEVMRKSLKAWLTSEMGTWNVTVVSTVASGPLLMPFFILYAGVAPHTWFAMQSPSDMFLIAVCSGLAVIIPAYLTEHLGENLKRTIASSKVQQTLVFTTAMLVHLFLCLRGGGGFRILESCLFIFVFLATYLSLRGCQSFAHRASGPSTHSPFEYLDSPEDLFPDRSLLNTIMASSHSKKLLIFLMITVFYMLVEMLYGFYSGSLGLVSDSFHMLLDSSSVAIALYASFMATWPSNSEYPFGYGRYEVLSGFTNGVLLMCIAVYIVLESVGRMLDPPDIDANWLLTVSVGGLVINLIGVIFFHEAHHTR
eukprot:Sspe_Gene.93934::Locus_66427_Transcript_1_1_Confidence_1.000_Length_1698::g.93934::m.93934/K14692/SLC30A5_7, ZNT5_7, MTP, MSC2; solute carrier family 30 (zinc transporter), member 5/7